MSRPYRFAVIGTGFFAQNHLHAWAEIPEVELVAVCDIDADRVSAAAAALRIGAAPCAPPAEPCASATLGASPSSVIAMPSSLANLASERQSAQRRAPSSMSSQPPVCAGSQPGSPTFTYRMHLPRLSAYSSSRLQLTLVV